MELTTIPQQSGMMQVATSRETQALQMAMMAAKRAPRDTIQSYTRIIEDCKRKTLAEKAIYAYPKGGTTVTGPTIRLAECLARNWGNLEFGIVELEKKPAIGNIPGESIVQAFCWDLETNTRSSTVFTVRHTRDKNIKLENGQKKKIQEQLTDDRDIYEMIANQGARRLRSRILALIPDDVKELAVEQCEKTMEGGQGPLIDRVRAVVLAFQAYAVTQEMIEKRLGHKIEATSEAELVILKTIGVSLKDGLENREAFFDLPQTESAKEEMTAKQSVDSHKAKSSEENPKKTKSIKNFAPPSKEAAEDWKAGDHHIQEKEIYPRTERNDLIKAIVNKQKELSWTTEKLSSFVEEKFKSKSNDLKNEDLAQLLIYMESAK